MIRLLLSLLVATTAARGETFSHDALDRVLRAFVDERGYVDYTALASDPADLDAYVAALREVSPKSHPARFPTRADELSYWINAYNALTLRGVLDAYPTKSVKDIKLFSGFFNRTHYEVGGTSLTLNDIEHDILRAEYGEPRIHAAINCASASCPRLENRAFVPGSLEDRLESAMRFFLNEERNVRIDVAKRRVTLSKILSWFEDDFTGWLERERGLEDAGILDYVTLYLDEPGKAKLDRIENPKVQYFDYDWSLNDQKGAAGR